MPSESRSAMTRTNSVRAPSCRGRTTWLSCTRPGRRRARSSSSRTSRDRLASLRPRSCSASTCSRSQAARFGSITRPSRSSEITPDETPDRTASMKRRRSSSCRLASSSARRCRSSCEVMRLKLLARTPTSSLRSGSGSATRALRSPCPTCSAAAMIRPIGAVRRLAKARPTQTAAVSSSSATTRKIVAKVTIMRLRSPSSC